MPPTSKDWIAVDLDRTLARRVSGDPITQIGDAIEGTCERVREWLADGRTVKIFTARVNPMHEDAEIQRELIRHWTRINLGQELEATCMKDRFMTELWDDLAIRVHENTGQVCLYCSTHVEISRRLAEPSETTELGVMVRQATERAHEHARLEAEGRIVSLTTPIFGTVTDPDELVMMKELEDQNIVVCPSCFCTGWKDNDPASEELCPCPYGTFLRKKTEASK